MSTSVHTNTENTDLPAQPSNQRRVVVALSIAGVIIVLAVTVFATFSSRFPLIGAAPAPTPVKDWQTYRDPGGHFTMSMPADWREVETSHGSTGFAGTSFQTTMYRFGPRDRIPNTPPPISFTVNILPIETAKQHSVICRPASANDLETRQIGHITAYSNDMTRGLGFNSQNAQFALTYEYAGLPGGIDNAGHRPPATPVTAAQTAAYHTIIELILDSFMPLPDVPLAC